MKKELLASIIIFIVIMIGFIFSVKVSEQQNNKYLRDNYVQSTQIRGNTATTIAAPTEKAIEYQQKKVTVWVIGIVLGMIVPAFFLFSGLSAGIRNWAQNRSKIAFIAFILYFIIYYLIISLISLPLDYYSSFVLKHTYGLSNQNFGKWIGDFLKSFAISIAAGSVLICIPYALIKKSPGYWWLYFGLLLIPVLFFITLISPVYIDPIFNKYEKVQDTRLEAKIYDLIDKTDIENVKVYQVNKSVDTKEMNAYMTGVLNTKRIVLWDTTIKNLTDRETLGIVAHEMGHYLMGHVWKAIILGGILNIFVFYSIDKVALWVINKSVGTFGVTKLHDIASLPLLMLLLSIFMFIVTPTVNAYSRYTETEADRFELELTKDNEASMSSMIKLHQTSLTLPRPGIVYKLWNYDHPTFEERVNFAKNYRPWEEGKALKYQKYIK
jgi:Zn-dependent protease with chaperone function